MRIDITNYKCKVCGRFEHPVYLECIKTWKELQDRVPYHKGQRVINKSLWSCVRIFLICG